MRIHWCYIYVFLYPQCLAKYSSKRDKNVQTKSQNLLRYKTVIISKLSIIDRHGLDLHTFCVYSLYKDSLFYQTPIYFGPKFAKSIKNCLTSPFWDFRINKKTIWVVFDEKFKLVLDLIPYIDNKNDGFSRICIRESIQLYFTRHMQGVLNTQKGIFKALHCTYHSLCILQDWQQHQWLLAWVCCCSPFLFTTSSLSDKLHYSVTAVAFVWDWMCAPH